MPDDRVQEVLSGQFSQVCDLLHINSVFIWVLCTGTEVGLNSSPMVLCNLNRFAQVPIKNTGKLSSAF